MLESYITPSRIANAVLLKTSFKGGYIIVEGKNDFTLYKKFTDEEFCRVEMAFGNSRVIEVINILNNRGYYDAIGIIDADFKNLDNEKVENFNIMTTDDHDLEMMILKSKAFEIVVSHYAKEDKVKLLLEERASNDLRDIFLQLATPLGYLKWANKKHGLGLVFKPSNLDGKPLQIIDFIPYKTLHFSSYIKMIEVVFTYSRQRSQIHSTQSACLELIEKMKNDLIDIYQLCNGHDVVTIICLALRHKIANYNSNAIQPLQFEESLIFSYDSRFFETTNLYKLIKNWEMERKRTLLKF